MATHPVPQLPGRPRERVSAPVPASEPRNRYGVPIGRRTLNMAAHKLPRR